jgi:ubiquinone/menaquinone biosynthesis C-methylase UbiE
MRLNMESKNIIRNNTDRFNGFAEHYDKYRPVPPYIIVEILMNYLGKAPSLIVDLGCGTGLSTFIWQNCSKKVVGIDPNKDMIREAIIKCNENKNFNNVTFQMGYGNDTGLETNSVDIVTSSSSFHWMEPESTLKEVQRILVDNGVFAIYYADSPSGIDWIVEKTYSELLYRIYTTLDNSREDKDRVKLWSINDYIDNMKKSGEFSFMKEIVVHSKVEMNSDKYLGLFFSQGAVQDVIKLNIESINSEINHFTHLVNERFNGRTVQAAYGYRVRLGIKK